MRFVGHIHKNGNLVARASVDDAEGESPFETAAKGMNQMVRDMRRNNGEMNRGETEEAVRDLADFQQLNEAYGRMIEEALGDREGKTITGYARGGHMALFDGMTVFAESRSKGMTCTFEAKTDGWIAETSDFLDRVLQRA